MLLDKLNYDEPMVGIDTVATGLGAFWGSVTGMGYRLVHEPLNIYGDDLMARYLVSCGNARVESATRAWEKRNYGRWQPLITNVIWGARVLPSSKASL